MLSGNNELNDGDLNPKVQTELEKLNTASAQINEFENKLQELRNNYYETLSKCSSNLCEISNKIGAAIPRARPYFELRKLQIELQKESQLAASRFETACIVLNHANGVVDKTESQAKESSKLDDSAMEILNIAITKVSLIVNVAKKEKTEAHREHQKYLSAYMEVGEKIQELEKKHKNDIRKSKDYFHFSKCMDEKLKEDKLNIELYEEKVKICKSIYNNSLQRLEDISNHIHEERKLNEQLGPRGEGVGAEVEKVVDNDIETAFNLKSAIIKEPNDNTSENDFSLSTTASADVSTFNLPRRRTTLASSTPIVDGLLKAALENKDGFLYGQNRDFYRTYPQNMRFSVDSNSRRNSDITRRISAPDNSGDHT